MAVRTTRSTVPLRVGILGGGPFPLRVPVPPFSPTVLDVQQAAGMDHIYDFNFSGDPLSDRGEATAANFVLSGTWTHAAASVAGTKGSYENLVRSNPNMLGTGLGAFVDLARTQDVWYEGIWEIPTPPATGNAAMVTAGDYGTAQSHSYLVWSTDHVKLWSPTFDTRIDVTGLDAAYLLDPTYIAVWWDHANTVYRLYYKKAGEAETALVSSSVGAGSAGSESLWASAPGVFISSAKAKVHMFALHRGELTAGHRASIYAAVGFV